MSEPAFERFPLDGMLYRLVCTGKICPATAHLATARVKVWFVLVDETNPDELRLARRQTGELSTLVVEEAAGSIPKLVLGSFWRDRTLQAGYSMPGEMTVVGATLRPQAWQVVRSNDTIGPAGTARIPADEYPQQGQDARAGELRFHDAPLVRCFAESGLELLIPCYEIFRRFYAMTSELSNAMLSGHWQRELQTLINPQLTGVSEDGKTFEVAPAVQMRDIGCSAIAYFMMVQQASRQASEIYLSIQNARRAGVREPWIIAKPPWTDQVMMLSFIGQQLRTGAVLVLWIFNGEFPRLPLPVVRIESELNVMVDDPDAPPKPAGASLESRLEELKEASIQPAVDARVSRATVHFGLDESWSKLARLRRRALRKHYIPFNRQPDSDPPPPRKRRLTTGRRSQAGRAPSASLSSDTQNAILNRFSALAECFEEMLQAGELRSREDYALVRPVQIGDAAYCAFPMAVGAAPRPWSIVNPPQPRPRLCWVSEITAPDEQFYYWIEVEALQREAFKALIVKPRAPGARLSADTLETILKVGALHRGQWKNAALLSIEEEIAWLPARHSFVSGRLRASVVLSKISSLR